MGPRTFCAVYVAPGEPPAPRALARAEAYALADSPPDEAGGRWYVLAFVDNECIYNRDDAPLEVVESARRAAVGS